MPSSTMATQGPGVIFHLLEVSQQAISPNVLLRLAQEMECNNTSPKSIQDYMEKNAQFGYGRIGSWCNISFLGGIPISQQP